MCFFLVCLILQDFFDRLFLGRLFAFFCTEVQEDLKKLRDIRYWVRKATPGTEESKEPPKKQPLKEVLQDKADEKRAQKNAPAQTKHKQQDMEL